MLDFLFGWRKASKCKKLIKKAQCRLKLLKSKRFAVVRLLKEDIAQLLKNGHELIAFNKLDQLYVEETVLSIYQMLMTFSEFILLNLSYIRRHKDIPNDINEAISTLIYASARFGDIPELRVLRKLFSERYGKKFVTAAIEVYPGNFVNSQVKDKFVTKSVTEHERNRMKDEIVRDYFFKLGQFAIEYEPDVREPTGKVASDISSPKHSSVTPYSLTSSIPNTPERSKLANFVQLSPPYKHKTRTCSSENSTQYLDNSVVYLDDVEEFKSPNKQKSVCDDQDQRIFLFKMETPKHDKNINNEKLAKKRVRRRSSASKENPTVNDAQREIYYNSSRGNRPKCQKKFRFSEIDNTKKIEAFDCSCKLQCSLEQPCYSYRNDNLGLIVPVEKGCKELYASRNTASPRHVHPKLPDYDEIAAKFKALKKTPQLSKA